jgi:hypothetical protein
VTFDTIKVGKKIELASLNQKKIDKSAPIFFIKGSNLPNLATF